MTITEAVRRAHRELSRHEFSVHRVEVSPSDPWDELVVTRSSGLPMSFVRPACADFRVEDAVYFTHKYEQFEHNREAIAELKVLMEQWCARGWEAEADAVEGLYDAEEESPYHKLGKMVQKSEPVRAALHLCKFYRYLPPDVSGFASVIREADASFAQSILDTPGHALETHTHAGVTNPTTATGMQILREQSRALAYSDGSGPLNPDAPPAGDRYGALGGYTAFTPSASSFNPSEADSSTPHDDSCYVCRTGRITPAVEAAGNVAAAAWWPCDSHVPPFENGAASVKCEVCGRGRGD